MEENLGINNEINKEIPDNNTKSNSQEIKNPKSDENLFPSILQIVKNNFITINSKKYIILFTIFP